MESAEDTEFLTTQIITYIGNKRILIYDIEKEITEILRQLGKPKCSCADIFSGSGIVARMMKQYSETLVANDLESYSAVINSCYLSNRSDFDRQIYAQYHDAITAQFRNAAFPGIITENYAPKNDSDIQPGERVFYTHENALRIDTYRHLIDEIVDRDDYKKFFLAPLLTEASVHVNTSGIFKGFYKDKRTGLGCFGGSGKNALPRILGAIELAMPVLSRFESRVSVFQKDAVLLADELKNIDIAYLDPPYNQHPYGSNYFMLNVILKNKIEAPMSRVSGIVSDWNRSLFNKNYAALSALEKAIAALDAKFIIISYNSEGFITYEQMLRMLKKYGSVRTVAIRYNTFRGSRNLRNRSLHVSEYLFILKKT